MPKPTLCIIYQMSYCDITENTNLWALNTALPSGRFICYHCRTGENIRLGISRRARFVLRRTQHPRRDRPSHHAHTPQIYNPWRGWEPRSEGSERVALPKLKNPNITHHVLGGKILHPSRLPPALVSERQRGWNKNDICLMRKNNMRKLTVNS